MSTAWVLVAGEVGAVLADALVSEAVASWADTAGLERVNDAALLVIADGQARLLVKGNGRVTMSNGSTVTSAVGDGWRTQSLNEVDGFVLSIGAPTDSAPRFRAVNGVFPAADVVVRRASDATFDSSDDTSWMQGETEVPVSDLLDATAAPGTPSKDARPLVPARACAVGHLNAPYAYDCRICGSTPLRDEVLDVPRPSLGRLRFSSGHVVEVDRPIVIGRAPSPHARTPQPPLLVSVPGADVSRNHVEVRPEDWTTLVIDLNSSNGTSVILPGRPPQRLRPQEPLQIIDGTEVGLTDSVSFRFEVSS